MTKNQDFAERFGGIQHLYGQAAVDVIQQMQSVSGVRFWAVEICHRSASMIT